jgi:hypothetical protein
MIAVPFEALVVVAVIAWAAFIIVLVVEKFRAASHMIDNAPGGRVVCRDCGPDVLCPDALSAEVMR